jgi:formylglycine-generating enzyme required for sulfatase activity
MRMLYVVVIMWLVFPWGAQAALLNVPDDHLTIQAAIDASVDGDEIVVSPGRYRECINISGKLIVLRSIAPNDPEIVATTIIDASHTGRVVTFAGTETSLCMLTGFTITGGLLLDSGYSGYGAGIYGNHSTARIVKNVIEGNVASRRGGGLANCKGLIYGNIIRDNTGSSGGALSECGGSIMNNYILRNYSSSSAGGLFACRGVIFGNTITYNKASAYYGGIGQGGGCIEGNIIAFNECVRDGGGIGGCGGNIVNNIIAFNRVTGDGYGGGGVASCWELLANNIIYGNTATKMGGGLYACSGDVINCIVWNNYAASGPELFEATNTTYSCIKGGYDGLGNISDDPLLVDPAAMDFHLQEDSPCIDTGTVGTIETDIEGGIRPNGSGWDMGPYEFGASQPTPTPTPTPVFTSHEIQDAIDQALPGDIVIIPPGLHREILTVTKSITLRGSGEHESVLDGYGIATVVSVKVADVTLENLKIQNATVCIYLKGADRAVVQNCCLGYTTGATGESERPGQEVCALWIENSNTCIIRSNTIEQIVGGLGGLGSVPGSSVNSMRGLVGGKACGIAFQGDCAEAYIGENMMRNIVGGAGRPGVGSIGQGGAGANACGVYWEMQAHTLQLEDNVFKNIFGGNGGVAGNSSMGAKPSGSGGHGYGIYFGAALQTSELAGNVFENMAGGKGAKGGLWGGSGGAGGNGIAAYATATVSNCRIADNFIRGVYGGKGGRNTYLFPSSVGGGDGGLAAGVFLASTISNSTLVNIRLFKIVGGAGEGKLWKTVGVSSKQYEMENSSSYETMGFGGTAIGIFAGSAIDTAVVHNTIYGATAGASVYGTGEIPRNLWHANDAYGMLIENSSGSIWLNNVIASIHGFKIEGNDTRGRGYGLALPGANDCTVDYNCYHDASTAVVMGTTTGEHAIEGDPLLSPEGRLLTGSPCINAGTSLVLITHDFEGDARPIGAGVDIGADEWIVYLYSSLLFDMSQQWYLSVASTTANLNHYVCVDLNDDGNVDDQDLLLLFSDWHSFSFYTPTSTPTPTPTKTHTPTDTPTITNTPTNTGTPVPTPTLGPNEIYISIPNLPVGAKPLMMVEIPSGSFMMGRYPGEIHSNDKEDPQHQVDIGYGFYMGKFEITQAQWEAMMDRWPGGVPRRYGVGNDYPAYYISWNNCQYFVEELNELGQGKFRLPSEAEWEYCCRATTTTRFYWGDDLYYTMMPDYAWFDVNDSPYGSKPVGEKLPNAWGLYDMTGNVWEWCEDDWHSNYSMPDRPDNGNAWVDSPRISLRVGRGGGWKNAANHCRSAYRISQLSNYSSNLYGFRLLMEPNTPTPTITNTPTGTLVNTNTPTNTCTPFPTLYIPIPDLPADAKPLVMLYIPSGSFMMGRYPSEQNSYSNEDPQHQVNIDYQFYMGKYEITKAQWEAVMGTTPWSGEANVLDHQDSPAVYVPWSDIRKTNGFLDKLNALGLGTFRLPSEAEWEYACRAETTWRFYWGDDPGYTRIGHYAWYHGNARDKNERYAHIVGLKRPNAWGLYDMIGNVWEWCEDDWHQSYSEANRPDNGGAWVDSPRGSYRVLHGGDFDCVSVNFCRSAHREHYNPDVRRSYAGLRIVLTQ